MFWEITAFLFIVLISFLVNYRTRFLSIRYPTIPGFYYIFFLLMTTTLIQPEQVELYGNIRGYNEFVLAITLHSAFFLLGVFVGFKPGGRSSLISARASEIATTGFDVRYARVLSVVAMGLFVHTLLTVKHIPVLEILRAGANESMNREATIIKESMFKESIGLNNYLWNLNRQVVFPLLILYHFLTLIYNRNRKNWVTFLFWLFIGVVNNAISGSLAPVALIFLMIGLTSLYVLKKVAASHLIGLFVAMMAFPVFMDFAASNLSFSDSSSKTIEKTVFRFSGETFKRSLDYFDAYHDEDSRLGGRTHKIFTFFSGEDYFNVANHIFVKNLPERKLFYASTGNQNAHHMGYMYSDFGMPGVVVSSLLLGYLLISLQHTCGKRLRGRLSFAAYIILVSLFWKLMGVQPFTILFSHGGVLLVLLIFFLAKRWSARESMILNAGVRRVHLDRGESGVPSV